MDKHDLFCLIALERWATKRSRKMQGSASAYIVKKLREKVDRNQAAMLPGVTAHAPLEHLRFKNLRRNPGMVQLNTMIDLAGGQA